MVFVDLKNVFLILIQNFNKLIYLFIINIYKIFIYNKPYQV